MSGYDRPDTRESMQQISRALDQDKPLGVRRFLNFQIFASTLLITLVIITGTAFAFTMNAETAARTASEERRAFFELRVLDILSSVEETQDLGHRERDEIMHMLQRIEEILDQHVEDGRIP